MVALDVSCYSAAQNAGSPPRRDIFMVVEEALLERLSEGKAFEERVQWLPLGAEQVGDVEVSGRLRGSLNLPRRKIRDAHHCEGLLHVSEEWMGEFVGSG